ncbi:MAG TPA: maleylacetate reductase [Gemmatimonadaceae bacterium]
MTPVSNDGPEVVFGAGSLEQLPGVIDRYGYSKVMIVSTPGRFSLTAKAESLLGDRVVAVFGGARVHVPHEIADRARRMAFDSQADVQVALGGGSAIGVSKSVALDTGIHIVAVPTTYSGSEMTPIWGLTAEGKKLTGRDPNVLPRVVIYDPDLTLSLTARVTACSGLNAIAHCVEALYAVDAAPDTSKGALEGLTLLASSLPRLAAAPDDREQRSHALRGAMLAGGALAKVQMALHHKLCHTIGGSFDLPHAETHAVLLPYTAAYNRDAAHDAMRAAALALGVEDAPSELVALSRLIDAPTSLKEIGMRETDIPRAAALAMERTYPNPAPLTEDRIRVLLEAAFVGDTEYVTRFA